LEKWDREAWNTGIMGKIKEPGIMECWNNGRMG
jgi:hypothetical protein